MLSRPYVLLPVFDLEKGESYLVFPFKIVDFGYFSSFFETGFIPEARQNSLCGPGLS